MTSTSAETVVFDVGGTTYKVSRSLLDRYPNTMLARMVSERWDKKRQSDQSESTPLFIERDGERFKYCLDYMRDAGRVALPFSIPKDAFLQDLAYYGFDNVNADTITIVGTLQASLQARNMFRASIIAQETQTRISALANYCARKIEETETLLLYVHPGSDPVMNQHCMAVSELGDPKNRETFDACLSVFGLKFKEYHIADRSYYLVFEFN